MICTLWSLHFLLHRLPLWCLLSFIVLWNSIALGQFLFIWCFKHLFLFRPINCLQVFFLNLFGLINLFQMCFGANGWFLLDFNIVVNLFAWKTLSFVFHVEVYLNIDVRLLRSRLIAIVYAIATIFIYHFCSYNYYQFILEERL